jgi:Domain of unknown function (DUF4864)
VEEPLNDGQIESQGSPPEPDPEPAAAPPAWQPALHRERDRRRLLLRRLAALLGTGTLAFTFTTWLLLRHESRSARASAPAAAKSDGPAQGPAAPRDEAARAAALRTARAMLAAMNKDDLGTAYSFFSQRYRSQVPLASFRGLVRKHREMFHTEEQDVKTRSQTKDRVLLDIHVSSDDDEDYVAQFTLVRIDGRWWVDQLHWSFDEDDQHSSA